MDTNNGSHNAVASYRTEAGLEKYTYSVKLMPVLQYGTHWNGIMNCAAAL